MTLYVNNGTALWPGFALRLGRPSDDFRFAAAVAEFGMLLRESEHRGRASVQNVLSLARGSLGRQPDEHRAGFVRMVEDFASLRRTEELAANR